MRHEAKECNPPPMRSKCTCQSCSLSAYKCLTSSTPLALLKQLLWLLIKWHIWFKLATLTFKTFHTNRPPYLTDLVQYYQPARSLRSSGSHQLVIPRHNLLLGSCGFSICTTYLEFTSHQHPQNPVNLYF